MPAELRQLACNAEIGDRTTGLVYGGASNNTLTVFVSASAPANGTAQAANWLPGEHDTLLIICTLLALVRLLTQAAGHRALLCADAYEDLGNRMYPALTHMMCCACSAHQRALPVPVEDLPAPPHLPSGRVRTTRCHPHHWRCHVCWQAIDASRELQLM